jgi:hypothetical protein
MNFFDIFVVVLYDNFYRMRERRRRVIPWFQTCATISLFLVIFLSLLTKIIMDILHNGYFEISFKEGPFLILFLVLMAFIFFLIKKFYFNNARHVSLYMTFKNMSSKKRNKYKLFTYFVICILPFIFIYILYLDDLHFRK